MLCRFNIHSHAHNIRIKIHYLYTIYLEINISRDISCLVNFTFTWVFENVSQNDLFCLETTPNTLLLVNLLLITPR